MSPSSPTPLPPSPNPLSLQHLSDEELLLRTAQNDPEAYQTLYHRHQKMLFNLGLHITRNRHLAEEAFQEAMTRIWRAARCFKVDGNAKGWMARILVRECLKRLSAQLNRRAGQAEITLEELELPAHPIQERAEQQEIQHHLRRGLQALPTEARTLLALYFGAGFKQRQIAKLLGLPQSSVSHQIAQAVQELRRGLYAGDSRTPLLILGAAHLRTALGPLEVPPAEIEARIQQELWGPPRAVSAPAAARSRLEPRTGWPKRIGPPNPPRAPGDPAPGTARGRQTAGSAGSNSRSGKGSGPCWRRLAAAVCLGGLLCGGTLLGLGAPPRSGQTGPKDAPQHGAQLAAARSTTRSAATGGEVLPPQQQAAPQSQTRDPLQAQYQYTFKTDQVPIAPLDSPTPEGQQLRRSWTFEAGIPAGFQPFFGSWSHVEPAREGRPAAAVPDRRARNAVCFELPIETPATTVKIVARVRLPQSQEVDPDLKGRGYFLAHWSRISMRDWERHEAKGSGQFGCRFDRWTYETVIHGQYLVARVREAQGLTSIAEAVRPFPSNRFCVVLAGLALEELSIWEMPGAPPASFQEPSRIKALLASNPAGWTVRNYWNKPRPQSPLEEF